MSEVEATVSYFKRLALEHRKALFWITCGLLLLLLIVQVKEVAVLLLGSYGIAILLDPLISEAEKKGVPRSVSIISLGLLLLTASLLLLLLLIPKLVAEYQQLVENLPQHLKTVTEKISVLAESWLGIEAPADVGEIAQNAREYLFAAGSDQLRAIGKTIGKTALQGYSLALTLLNLLLLPFFVFYIARDLRPLHRAIGSFLSKRTRRQVASIGGEILAHVYGFFRGQLTVSIILAVLYSIGFGLAGLPWSAAVGTLTGLLNIVPYLGVAIGLLLATILTIVSDPSLGDFIAIYSVFLIIQIFEGNFLTPKIVGEQVGIHPLGVMIALIIGGDLLGLLGMILAIPAAAAMRVLFQHLRRLVENSSQAAA